MELNAPDFILHSDLVPLSYPFKTGTSIDSGTSLSANQRRRTNGPWFETGPGSLGVNAFLTIGNKTWPDFIQEYQLRSGQFQPRMNAWVEKDSNNRVRVVLEEFADNAAYTYPKVTVSVKFYMVHIV